MQQYSGVGMVTSQKLAQLEADMSSLQVKVTQQLSGLYDNYGIENKVRNLVMDELYVHSKQMSLSTKQSLSIQQDDTEALVKRLGV